MKEGRAMRTKGVEETIYVSVTAPQVSEDDGGGGGGGGGGEGGGGGKRVGGRQEIKRERG